MHTVSLQVQIDHSFPACVLLQSQFIIDEYIKRQRVSSYGICKQLNMCLCECEEWEDGRGFYLGATQLQITQQITPVMIKAQERRLTFFLPEAWAHCQPLPPPHVCPERYRERGTESRWGRHCLVSSAQRSPISKRNTCFVVIIIPLKQTSYLTKIHTIVCLCVCYINTQVEHRTTIERNPIRGISCECAEVTFHVILI